MDPIRPSTHRGSGRIPRLFCVALSGKRRLFDSGASKQRQLILKNAHLHEHKMALYAAGQLGDEPQQA
jgi:hypothetical protein